MMCCWATAALMSLSSPDECCFKNITDMAHGHADCGKHKWQWPVVGVDGIVLGLSCKDHYFVKQSSIDA